MLYLVATPIGNLGDITLRALDTLREVDVVVSEDTRKTGLMLKHFEIKKPQISFYEPKEARALPKILALLAEGKSVALVSNAGSPAISDPGFTLVRAALEAGLPGDRHPRADGGDHRAGAVGLAVHSFTFRGFPPRKPGARRHFMEVDLASPHTLIFYESPHRLVAFLEDARAVYGDRRAAVANDLTKLFETVIRGTLVGVHRPLCAEDPRGEYTVVIEGAPEPEPEPRRRKPRNRTKKREDPEPHIGAKIEDKLKGRKDNE
jgi:16S rRNA (cytidine1402-2'-O)-methyltransferase